jgi:hypothetical protein
VDIGGATVDMAVIYKEPANKFSIVSKDTQPLGIEIVINGVIDKTALRKNVRKCLYTNVINTDYINTNAEYSFFEKVRTMFAMLAMEVKNKHSARDILISQNGVLKIIICGGGANYNWYKRCILSNRETLRNTLPRDGRDCQGYKLEIIPIKKFLESSEANNHRMLIAKGLAQRVEGIPVLENFPWHFRKIEWKERDPHNTQNFDDISIEKYGELN